MADVSLVDQIRLEDDVPAGLQEKTEESIAASVELLERWHGAANGRIRYCFAPRFALSCTSELLTRVAKLARERQVMVHTHASENRHECELVERDSGLRNVAYLDSLGVPRNKMVIGAAFYGRMWGNVEAVNNGLYQSGQFKRGIAYRNFPAALSPDSGYVYFRDTIANAPYIYHPSRKEFVTYEDVQSIVAKTRYAKDNGLRGIMFWQLAEDTYENGLLEAIDRVVKSFGIKK